MSSEKTLNEKEIHEKAVKQAQTFAAKVLMGLSAANVPPEIMKFYIDSPHVLNNSCKIFAKEPFNITVVGSVGSPAILAAAYLELNYLKICNAYHVHRQITEEVRATVYLPPWVDLMLFDIAYLADVSKRITEFIEGSEVGRFKFAIGIGSEGAKPFGYKGMVFCQTWKEAVLYVIDWQLQRIRSEVSLALVG